MSYDPRNPYYQMMLRQAAQAAAAGMVSGLDAGHGVGNFDFVGNIPAYPYAPVEGMDFVGAAMQKAAMMAQAPMYRPAATPFAHGVAIPPPGVYTTDNSPRVPRRKPAGFPIAIIPLGGQTVLAQMLPTEVIRPERLVIVDASGGTLNDVFVDDIKVGSQSQNIGQGAIPASVFDTLAFDTLIEGNTLNLGVPITVSLRLLAPAVAARPFSLAIIGRSAQG